MDLITSPKNPRVVEAARLHRSRHRRSTGRTVLEGPKLLEEAVAAGISIGDVFGLQDDLDARLLADRAGAAWLACTQNVLDRLTTTETTRGPVAVIDIPPPNPITRDVLLVLVNDPGNAGTLVRTAAAFGMDVVVGDQAVDVWSPKVLRSAAGSHFLTAVNRDPGSLPPDTGLIATVVDGGTPVAVMADELDPSRRYAVAVGSEAHGLGTETMQRADHFVTIPMPGGTESLNAAVSGAIVGYELMAWRNSESGTYQGH